MNVDELGDYYDRTDTSETIDAGVVTSQPGTGVEAMAAFTVRLPLGVLDHFRQQATAAGVTTGEVLRKALQDAAASGVVDERTVTVGQLRALIAQAS